MLLARVLLVLAGVGLVLLVLAYALGGQQRFLAWAGWLLRVTVGFAVVFGLFYVLERLLLL